MSKIIIVGPASPLRGGYQILTRHGQILDRKRFFSGNNIFSLQYPKFLFPGKSQNRVEQSENFNFKYPQ